MQQAMSKLIVRLVVIALVLWILATVISPSYDLPNSVLRASKSAPAAAFDFLLTAAILLCCVFVRFVTQSGPTLELSSSRRVLALTCVRLC
jgi:Tfp pilus assembly protein PilE